MKREGQKSNIQQHFVTAVYLAGFTPNGSRGSRLTILGTASISWCATDASIQTLRKLRPCLQVGSGNRRGHPPPKPGGEKQIAEIVAESAQYILSFSRGMNGETSRQMIAGVLERS